MGKNANFVSHKKSKQIVDGKPKLPLASDLVEGEIAINFGKDVETLSIKNESGDVVTFSSDNYYTEKKLGSGFTGENSGVTVTDVIGSGFTFSSITDVIIENEEIISAALGDLNERKLDASAEMWVSGSGISSAVLKEGNSTASGGYSVAEGYNTTANNYASHAEGYGTKANGQYSHAEGYYSTAKGSSSHAEGSSTTASGNRSHAEGSYTTASGDSSHAEGGYTTANGSYSHAGGYYSTTNGSYSHAEGAYTTASGGYSHTEGLSTTANGSYSHAEGRYTRANNDSEHASGQYNISSSASTTFGDSGNTLFSVGNGTATNARHNAFEIRQNGDIYITSGGTTSSPAFKLQDCIGSGFPSSSITDVIINDEKIVSFALNDLDARKLDASAYTPSAELWVSGTGLNSVVLKGSSGTASGDYSVAEGQSTSATSQSSHAEGRSTKANGLASHAEGNDTIASGSYSHAEGSSTTASGQSSHAEGERTTASGPQSHAEGAGTTASGPQSHAEGAGTTASGTYSHAEGVLTTASGPQSHAEGAITKASGQYSHAEGNATSATTEFAHAEGTKTLASSYGSHAEGGDTKAIGSYSHTEGYGTSATTYTSHAEGNNTLASGNYGSHAEGQGTTASGQSSHAEGYSTKANGDYSHAEGWSTTANNQSEHASGQYNVSNSASTTFGNSGNTLFSVGNGTYGNNHNAFEIRQNGDIYITSGSSDIKLQDYIGNVETVTAITPSNSGSTDPIATKVVAENELTVSNALIDLDERKLDASAYTPTDLSNYYTKDEISIKEYAIASSLVDLDDRLNNISFDIDQVINSGTSASTNAVSTKAVYSALTESVNEIETQLDGLKLKKITQSQYDALAPNYDSNTLYVIVD